MPEKHPFETMTVSGVGEDCLRVARDIIDIDLVLSSMQVAIVAVTPDQIVQHIVFGHPSKVKELEAQTLARFDPKEIARGDVCVDFPNAELLAKVRASLIKSLDGYLRPNKK